MIQKICQLLLRLFNWESSVTVAIPSKCVICVAPHTSNTDFFIAKLFYTAIGEAQPSFLMKKEWFFFPLSYLLKAMGGIPVNRKKKQSMTEQMAEEFQSHEKFHLAIAPEGTRKKNPNWKTGFYYIAQTAHVPILLAYIDYASKKIGIGKIIFPSGDEKRDMHDIKEFYKHFKGKHPENFSI